MDANSLQKLTVAQLREKLKLRNLQSTGTKSELIERLLESYQEEENLLAGTEENDGLDDVDDLLGSSELDKPSLTSNEEALLLGLPSKTHVPKPADAPKAAPQKVESKPTISATLTKPTISAKPQETVKKPEITSPVEGNGEAKSATEAAPRTTKQPIRPKIAVEAAVTADAKKRRAERFGLPIRKSSETEQKAAISETKPDGEISNKHPISLNSSSKLLERAKRFGLPVQSDENESNGASKPKIPRIAANGGGDDKKQARLQRFAS